MYVQEAGKLGIPVGQAATGYVLMPIIDSMEKLSLGFFAVLLVLVVVVVMVGVCVKCGID